MKSWVMGVLRILPAIALFAATPSYAHRVDTIKGTISRFDGATTMYVRDVKGYIDNVSLHRGTIINPTGIRLRPGFAVTISGHPAGATFVADEIDTPYQMTYGYPGFYPYPYWGPSVALGFGFGWGGGYRRWH